MASYNPADYVPGPPPPATGRPRGNPGADGYRPRTYSHPPPNQPDPNLLGPQQQPYAAPAPYPQQAPFPQPDNYRPDGYVPAPHPAQAYAQPQYPPVTEQRADGYDPREDYNRRPSYSSQRSGHSHHSRRSHDSRRSRDSRRSHRSHHSGDDRHHHHHHRDHEPGERHHRHHHRHFSDDVPSDLSSEEHYHTRDGKTSKKKNSEKRPTVGDSMWSVLSVFKSALGPRDKY